MSIHIDNEAPGPAMRPGGRALKSQSPRPFAKALAAWEKIVAQAGLSLAQQQALREELATRGAPISAG
jgi:hypothetical protein